MIEIECWVNAPFYENTYVLYEGNEAYLIDPGGSTEEIINFVNEKKLKLNAIINTHGHIDHIVSARELQDHFKIPFYLNENEKIFIDELPNICRYYGIDEIPAPKITHFLDENSSFMLHETKITTLFTPGHSPGHICFLVGEGILMSGDLLFKDSIGRTDLPGANMDQMIQSLKKVMKLKDEVIIYSGHGAKTTIGQERKRNPFIREFGIS